MGSNEPPKSAMRRGWWFVAVRCNCAVVNAPPGTPRIDIFSQILGRKRYGFMGCCVSVLGGSILRVGCTVPGRSGDPVQGIGYRAHQLANAFPGCGRNGVEFQPLLA